MSKVRAQVWYWDPEKVTAAYRNAGATVIPNPYSEDVLTPIIVALEKRRPFSAIRIGDGEANVLACDPVSDMPNLAAFATERSIAIQHDSFHTDPLWMSIMQELMFASILQSDLVGVVGLWRFGHGSSTERVDAFCKRFFLKKSDWRGQVGQYFAVHSIMKLAAGGLLKGKFLASARFYFAVLMHMERLISFANKVIVITNRRGAFERLRKEFTSVSWLLIPVGVQDGMSPSAKPDFLQNVRLALPADLSGCLCLVGAGIWAEFYCSWIKRRGGVAVDFGSGFDLLEGKASRPVHAHFA